MTKTENSFVRNYETEIDKKYIEVKANKFKYVSWTHALKLLKAEYPEASIDVVRFPDENGNIILPYLKTETGYYVETVLYLTALDRSNHAGFNYIYPVYDFKFNTHLKPLADTINKSIQRCHVKNIAQHTGIGLYIYAGEDIPSTDSMDIVSPKKQVDFPKQETNSNILKVDKKEMETASTRMDKLKAQCKESFGKCNSKKDVHIKYGEIINAMSKSPHQELRVKSDTPWFKKMYEEFISKTSGELNESDDDLMAQASKESSPVK